MTAPGPESAPFERYGFDAAALMAEHLPRVHDPNKQTVLDIACPPGAVHRGRVDVSRWAAMELPATVEPVGAHLMRPVAGYFDYGPASDAGAIEWHVNFADPHLFVAYAGGLFAQDEMQVAEHPVLAAVREALLATGSPALTVEDGAPTPVLVAGAERRRTDVVTDSCHGRGRRWQSR